MTDMRYLTSVAPLAITVAIDSEQVFTSQGYEFTLAAERNVKLYWDGSYAVQIPGGGNVTVNSNDEPSVLASGSFETSGTYLNEQVHGAQLLPGALIEEWGTAAHGLHSFEAGDYPGFASTLQPYDAAVNVDPGYTGSPLVITAPTTLQKTRTNLVPPNNGRDGMILDMGYLTFVSALPPDNAFRPAPLSADKTSYFTIDDVDLSFLPNVPAPASMPSYETLLGHVSAPWQTVYQNGLISRNVMPKNHQQTYGRDMAHEISEVLLALCTDGLTSEQKMTLALNLIANVGLDILGNAIAGANWGRLTGSYGGGQHWVKAPAIFTAHALRNANNTSKAAELLARVDFDNFIFTAEDRMWSYVSRTEIESFPDQRPTFDHIDFKDYMERAPLWNSKPLAPTLAGAAFAHVYKRLVWSGMIGQALALQLMGIENFLKPAVIDFMDFFYDQSELETPSAAPNWIRPFPQDMLDNHQAAQGPNFPDAALPSVVRAVGRGKFVWLEFDKLLSRQSIPASSAFVVEVNSSPVTLVSRASDDFTDTVEPLEFDFRSPDCYGYSMAVELDTPLTGGETVTIAYTKPGTNNAVTLGGAEVPTIAATAVTNLTGVLPDPPASVDTVNGQGTGDSDRQFSGTTALPPFTMDWMQLSYRFRLESLSTDDTLLGAQSTSSTLFWFYSPNGTHLYLFIGGGTRVELNNADVNLPIGTGELISMHLYVDYAQADEADAVKVYFEWDGGSWEPTIGSVVRTPNTPDLAGVFLNGIFLGGPLTPDTNRGDASHNALVIRAGQGSTPAVPVWTDAAYRWDADWGGNGQNVWGEPRYYYAGPLVEWNGGVPNRGNGGTLPLSPRLFDEVTEDNVTDYAVAA